MKGNSFETTNLKIQSCVILHLSYTEMFVVVLHTVMMTLFQLYDRSCQGCSYITLLIPLLITDVLCTISGKEIMNDSRILILLAVLFLSFNRGWSQSKSALILYKWVQDLTSAIYWGEPRAPHVH